MHTRESILECVDVEIANALESQAVYELDDDVLSDEIEYKADSLREEAANGDAVFCEDLLFKIIAMCLYRLENDALLIIPEATEENEE